nr:hypothetical protein [Pandoravirus belohorizontensis]
MNSKKRPRQRGVAVVAITVVTAKRRTDCASTIVLHLFFGKTNPKSRGARRLPPPQRLAKMSRVFSFFFDRKFSPAHFSAPCPGALASACFVLFQKKIFLFASTAAGDWPQPFRPK